MLFTKLLPRVPLNRDLDNILAIVDSFSMDASQLFPILNKVKKKSTQRMFCHLVYSAQVQATHTHKYMINNLPSIQNYQMLVVVIILQPPGAKQSYETKGGPLCHFLTTSEILHWKPKGVVALCCHLLPFPHPMFLYFGACLL